MVMIDNAVYVGGDRVASPASLEQTSEQLAEHPGGFAWIGLYRPDEAELREVAREFEVHPLIIEDAANGHQRPKVELYGDTLFTVLRAARYLDEEERVEFGEVHVITTPTSVIVIRHSENPNFAPVRERLEARPDRLAEGPAAVLFEILDEIVDAYAPVVSGLENDIDEIEDALFSSGAEQSQRIYELGREVIEFHRATMPLQAVIHSLREGRPGHQPGVELTRALRDVEDHITRVVERVDGFRALLQNALAVNSALVGERQNEEMRRVSEASYSSGEDMKKISSWAAIIFAPSLVGSIYGMNFTHMPELHWGLGYPMALAMMLGFAGFLYVIFKRRNWL